ncbi:MAG TPA: bilirubin oxidase, partial [Phaeodactylibacter sp.]|nr:bilirubin oxidase [Phaeodactylibacter sp.]
MNKILFFLFAFSLYSWAQGQNPLAIPPVLSGTEIELNLQPGSVQFYGGEATATMGANGDILGPTLILQQGDFVQFTVNNQLEDTTTLHWHGMHVSAENDGGPHTTIPPGTSWTPSFTILDKAATYWYHPHLHKKTDKHVSKGIAGLILVKDSEEAQLPLPRTYGVDDFPLVIQTKDFDANNQIVVHSNSDDVIMVNATLDPFLSVPAQVVRFRVLNGSSQRVFNLGLSNNQTFYQIASDGGLLAEPYETTRLRLGPGERAELLVDFSGMEGQTPYLKSYASELPNGFYGATYPGMGPGLQMAGYNPNPLNGSDFNILQFQVGVPTTDPVTAVPASLVEVTPLSESDVNETRSLTFTPEVLGPNQLNGQFLINDAFFDMEVINVTVPLDNVEIWELTNFSGIA